MTAKQKEYYSYLRSKEWSVVCRMAVHSANHRCQLCNSSHQLNVHHKTYANLGREVSDDVIVLCRICHARFHGKLEEIPFKEKVMFLKTTPELDGFAKLLAYKLHVVAIDSLCSPNYVHTVLHPKYKYLLSGDVGKAHVEMIRRAWQKELDAPINIRVIVAEIDPALSKHQFNLAMNEPIDETTIGGLT